MLGRGTRVRHWQESASADRWRHLATQFPEAIPETEFLLVLATTGDDNQARATRWRARYGFHVGYGTPCRGCLYARGAGTTRFSGPARTRRARRSGDGLRLGGRSRIPAGTRCLKAWTGLLAFCCASKIAVGEVRRAGSSVRSTPSSRHCRLSSLADARVPRRRLHRS